MTYTQSANEWENYPTSYTPGSKNNLKKWGIITVIIAMGLFGFLWIYSHAFIEIVIDNPGNSNQFTYKITNQTNNETSEIKSSSATTKKIVTKGSYEVTATNSDGYGFVITKTSGFLKKTTVHVSTKEERQRQFVGNNPVACMNYINNLLLSYGCNSSYGDIQLHLAATTDQSTYTIKNQNTNVNGSIEGIIHTSSGPIALIQATDGLGHIAYHIGDNATLTNGVLLSNLDASKSYTLQPFRDGFVAYDATFTQAFYYSSITSSPTQLDIEKPKNRDLETHLIDVSDKTITVVYSAEHGRDEGPEDTKIPSEVMVFQNNQWRHFTFDRPVAGASMCGVNRLCILQDENLLIYDTSGTKLNKLFDLTGVNIIKNTATGLLAIREHEIIALDIDKRTGTIDYRFGDYTYCGIETLPNNAYLLCLINNKRDKVALYIDQNSADISNIDKKVAQLQKIPEVSEVSVYKNYIYITPNLGELVYDDTTNTFGYDPAKKSSTSNKIDTVINKLGIDRKLFTIVNTLE